ncbi:zinc-binding dehydrogenase [Pectobacterium versatile]|uniref:zinc-binding dehydrogenase n=1 Tax=Pectobacterium versatile TaxID=2488639 RepID=UPI00301A905E
MKAIQLRAPGGLERLEIVDLPDPGAPEAGHIALIGVLTGPAGPMPTAGLTVRQQRLQGLIVGSRQHQQDLVRALNVLPIRPIIDKRFPLVDLAEAFRLQQAGGHFGKICLEY